MPNTLIVNIGAMVSGDIGQPLIAADSLYIEGGRIKEIGRGLTAKDRPAETVIDVRGATVIPGLIDGHVHPVFGDFCPAQESVHWIRQYLHCGVTSMVSAGELHLPGLPLGNLTPRLVKYLAVLARATYDNERPHGVKVHGGTVLLVPGLTEADFDEFAATGIKLVKFIFYNWAKAPEGEAQRYVAWAHERGIRVKLHSGGVSRSGISKVAGWNVVGPVRPDIIGHINGGPIPMPEADMLKIVRETDLYLEYCYAGNFRIGQVLLQAARETPGAERRVVVGTDTPSGTGVTPRAMLRALCYAASMSDFSGAEVVCMATGNTATAHSIEGGFIRPGAPADLAIIDRIEGSVGEDALGAIKAGDLPGVGVVLIDGELAVSPRSEQTPPPSRIPTITKA